MIFDVLLKSRKMIKNPKKQTQELITEILCFGFYNPLANVQTFLKERSHL